MHVVVTDLRTGLRGAAPADTFLQARELACVDLRSTRHAPSDYRGLLVDPLKSTGMLMHDDGSEFLGTAFAFRTGQHYLTAAHCVGELEPSALMVMSLGQGYADVQEIVRHPTAGRGAACP